MQTPRQNLRIPGPIPCAPEVMDALMGPMINHRGPEFKEMLYDVTEKLKRVFMTDNDVYILTASGTGALEASLVNTLSPGDKVLAAITGSFGKRFADIAAAYGSQVTRLEFDWGTPADPRAIQLALQKDPDIKAVLVTHNETSTGVTNDLEAVAGVVKGEFDKLLLVDAISSLSCIPVRTDQWGCDVVAAGSQKGLMIPPGLSFVSFSSRAWQAQREARAPRYYYDLAEAQRYLEKGQTPFTPAVSLFYALARALDLLLSEGLDQVFSRHARIADLARQRAMTLGLELLPGKSCASNTVTAIRVPAGVDGKALVNKLREQYSVVVGGGQGPLEGKIIRIGHMGIVAEEEIEELFSALQSLLPQIGHVGSV